MYNSEHLKPVPMKIAVEAINANNTSNCIWFPVVTSCGNKIELGGNYKIIIAEVLLLDSSRNIVPYTSNGNTQTTFSLTFESAEHQTLSTAKARGNLKLWKTREDFINFLELEKNLNCRIVVEIPVYRHVECYREAIFAKKEELVEEKKSEFDIWKDAMLAKDTTFFYNTEVTAMRMSFEAAVRITEKRIIELLQTDEFKCLSNIEIANKLTNR